MAKVVKKPNYQVIEGVRIPAMYSPKCFREALSYKPHCDDVFIATYPKCGTTWMQNLCLLIFRKGKKLTNQERFFEMCPSIDMLGLQGVNRMPRPGAIKTHLPYDRLPYSPDAKYIFVTRNPKDCCVSLYHHTKMIRGFGYTDGTFSDFFELFMTGEVENDDYFDHLLSWFPYRHDSNVFYTTYENMKQNTEGNVVKLANFLGKEYGDMVRKDNVVLKNILHYSSFSYMKKNLCDSYDRNSHKNKILNDPNSLEGLKYLVRYVDSLNLSDREPKFDFVRKGSIGDWRNYFTNEQHERLQKKFEKRTRGTGIPSLWSNDVLQSQDWA